MSQKEHPQQSKLTNHEISSNDIVYLKAPSTFLGQLEFFSSPLYNYLNLNSNSIYTLNDQH